MDRFFTALVIVLILAGRCSAQNFWQPLNGPKKGALRCVAINPQNHIICKADSLYRSTDNGNTWQKASPLSFEVSAVSFSSAGNVYLSTPYEIYRSTDNCSSWVRMGVGLSGPAYTKIVFHASGPAFIGSATNGVFKSENDCSTFVSCNTGLTNLKIKDILLKPNGYLFVATDGGGVFLSTDGGGNWTAVNGTMTQKAIYYLALKSSGELICINVNGRIFSSPDNGNTWVQVPTITFAATPRVFQMNPLDHIYVFMNSVMYRTTNNGAKWDTVNTGLTGGRFESSAINASGFIFLGDASSSGNMHRSVQSTTDAEEPKNITVSAFTLFQNYPNPFNPSTTIKYRIPIIRPSMTERFAGLVSLKVYNSLGKEIAVLFHGEKEPGDYTVTLDASLLPSGTYFYELRANSFRTVKKMILLR